MSESNGSGTHLAGRSRRLGRRLLAMGGNRLELLLLELADERRHLLSTGILALGAGVLALLAGMGLTATLVIVFWNSHPIAVLASLTILYAGGAWALYLRVAALGRDWKILPATHDQLRKDGECLDKILH